MRPIDADALKLYIDKEVEEDKVLAGWAFFFKAYLDDAPTIDIDRPQGKWIRIEWNESIEGYIIPMRTYKCSVCGEKEAVSTRFCPLCGVRMKGVDDEHTV